MNIHYHVHKSLPLHIPSHIKSIQTPISYLFNFQLRIIRTYSWAFQVVPLLRFPHQNIYAFLFVPYVLHSPPILSSLIYRTTVHTKWCGYSEVSVSGNMDTFFLTINHLFSIKNYHIFYNSQIRKQK